MALLPSNPDYSDRDFDSLRARMQNLVQGVFPTWTAFEVANFGNILVELFAFVGDTLGFYLDNQGRESRIVSVTQRKNMIALAKLLTYTPTSARAATADVDLTLAEVPANDVILPAGLIVRTTDLGDAVEFQLPANATIVAGSNPPTVSALVGNSKGKTDIFPSTSLPNQVISLNGIPYIDDTANISATDGVYTEVVNFLDSTSTDKHFIVVVDQQDQAEIRFGNGVNGAIPQGTITILYKIGGGERGNVAAGSITIVEGTYLDVLSNPVTVTVGNSTAASGGADRQGIESIRQLAPASLRVLNRTVAREDYEINSLLLPEVSRSLMLTSNEDATIEENQGILYIVPTGGGLPSSGLKSTVLEQVTVTFPNTLTFVVFVQDPVYLPIDVAATVFLAQGRSTTAVRVEIETALGEYFSLDNVDGTLNTNIDFGFNYKDNAGLPSGEVPWSDIFNAIRDVDGVRKISDGAAGVLLNGESSDVPILVSEFPALGTITLIDGDTGLAF